MCVAPPAFLRVFSLSSQNRLQNNFALLLDSQRLTLVLPVLNKTLTNCAKQTHKYLEKHQKILTKANLVKHRSRKWRSTKIRVVRLSFKEKKAKSF